LQTEAKKGEWLGAGSVREQAEQSVSKGEEKEVSVD
jgi:hypothetical protein